MFFLQLSILNAQLTTLQEQSQQYVLKRYLKISGIYYANYYGGGGMAALEKINNKD